VSGATTLRLRMGRNTPLLNACMAFMGDHTLTVIISFGKLMPKNRNEHIQNIIPCLVMYHYVACGKELQYSVQSYAACL